MKRLVCLLILLAMLPAVAVCEEYEYKYIVGIIETMLDSYKCLEMPEKSYDLPNDDGTESRYFIFDDDLRIVIKTDGETVKMASVGCYHHNHIREFLVICLSELIAFDVPTKSAMSAVFNDYLFAETGDTTPESYGNGIYSSMTYDPEKELLLFFVMKVN